MINWKDVNFYKSYDGYKAYAQSKLAMVMHTKELARRLVGTNIHAFSVNPGNIPCLENSANIWMSEILTAAGASNLEQFEAFPL